MLASQCRNATMTIWGWEAYAKSSLFSQWWLGDGGSMAWGLHDSLQENIRLHFMTISMWKWMNMIFQPIGQRHQQENVFWNHPLECKRYPLLNIRITTENCHSYRENSIFPWPFWIAMIDYQRVCLPTDSDGGSPDPYVARWLDNWPRSKASCTEWCLGVWCLDSPTILGRYICYSSICIATPKKNENNNFSKK